MTDSIPTGLSAADAAARLAQEGPNQLDTAAPRTAWHMALEVAREPMFQMLVAAGLLYLLLGDTGEALMLLAFVGVTVGITVVQGQRTEQALMALRNLASPRAVVVRGGERLRIAGHGVVRGDLLVLSEGDRVAADAWLLSANDLSADESLLTGEAAAVEKAVAPPAGLQAAAANATRPSGQPNALPPGGTQHPLVYAGTLVVAGHGLAQVLATGTHTEMGRIGRALGDITSPPTPLALQTRRLVKLFSLVGLSLSVLVVALYGLLRSDWTGGLLAGITLAMSMLPEEFLLILTVFMAMGAWRLSKQRVLTRRAATIEALGAATVLCTDKTGTLTQNRMAIAEMAVAGTNGDVALSLVWRAGEGARPPLVPQAFHEMLTFGMLASEREPFDAMDKAFLALGRASLSPEQQRIGWTLVHDHGLDPHLRVMTHVWQAQAPADPTVQVAVKGAHESVVALCRLSEAHAQVVGRAAEQMASRGLRVLAVAQAQMPAQAGLAATSPAVWPDTVQAYAFQFLGLVGLADPLRPGVPGAVRECREAGIRVVMVTGDHPATAQAMAQQAGIDTSAPARTGADLTDLDDAALRHCVATTQVFARVLPEQKLRIVEALKANGQVVAMTGDGVNDAPSLKAAHIGVAMGQRGTDVAREAASLVLLDDDFGSIVSAVRLGRRIYDNLIKAMAFAFAVHVPIAGLSLLPLLFGLPLVFTPVHIAFLELLIDPVCSIVFESEPEEGNVMQRPPRNAAAPLFSGALIATSLAQGALVLLATAVLFVGLLHQGVAEAQARATTFTALVACSVALIVANRSLSGHLWAALRRPNPALWRMVAATAALLALVLLVPWLRASFHFAALSPSLLGLALAVATAVLLVLEMAQPLRKRWLEVTV
jgi:P-type Ca2+ transporter type 2C